ncbi:MAG: high frequency lysogenization protein HflD [Gammaproteobacteria bacterium]|jgi:high frequency lysogenization protein|nr:high frequency lysogenization protein HflD [Gammaproteobacteria bacterium]
MSHLNRRLRDRTLALAGVFQATRLAQQLAREGRAGPAAIAVSIHSVLEIDSATTDDIYGGARGVVLGLQLLRDKLKGHADPNDMEMARYIINVVQLERRLSGNRAMLAVIRDGIESTIAQMKFFRIENKDTKEQIHPNLAAKLAELYTMTLSTLTPRIIVNGEQGYLENPSIVDKVRSLLLAATRSAFLWRQLGGRRWQLLLRRNAIIREATQILDDIKEP